MISISKETAKVLELHVLDYQNRKIEIANRYLADYQKYMQVLDFFNWYIRSIESFINRTDISAGELALPFVIIGSTVDVRDASGQKKHSLFIKEPKARHTNPQREEISCISGPGRSLLFKKEGADIALGGDGLFSWKIVRIGYDFKL
jgi:transcription elongation GreA/GreB family factor